MTAAVKATSGEEKDAAVPLDVDALLAEIDMPDVGLGISHWQKEIGATFDENGVATTFGNDEQALEAITSGAVLVGERVLAQHQWKH